MWLFRKHASFYLVTWSTELMLFHSMHRKRQTIRRSLRYGTDYLLEPDCSPLIRMIEKFKKQNISYVLISIFIQTLFSYIILDYTPAFSCLVYAKKPYTDIFSTSIPDARCHLAKCLQTLTAAHPNQVC